ncbi:MAG: hypothetical protein ACD_81C00067G0005 [uncultured bacterium]|uniref:histidine kinase n=2 Tax=Candidatus Wolfeibacteriota TaxID=1752735 RepID=A0A0G1K4Y1_9BACT|nr:MAG: hypothetical protein ACD_81C00067G0005 [uncultured bacterium]KKR12080.1 MAG: Two-component sensor histidine kinase [Candidatus Wolfebacteria bacterium GW2011_GWC2_39_22]KKT42904.1 MAG: Two-component sensor histidine kinase [Candidatus Wolfebacteria bacterium GW2011_GWE2_44_13]HBI25315.1 hypothetical protein [Candidatus Wolfebacteria bacterium]
MQPGTITAYLKMPEMRPFWYFLPLALVLIGINSIYLQPVWIMISASIFLVMGTIIFLNGIRIVRLNGEIKLERNELGSIVANLLDGLIAYDQNFKVVMMNKAAQQILGAPIAEVMGKRVTPESVKDQKLTLLAQVLYPSIAPLVVRRTEGGIYPQIVDMSFTNPSIELRVSTDRIVDPNGTLLGFVKIIHERTREVAMLKSKSEFIEVAAHQLRTPLTSINWIFESLAKETMPDEQKEMVGMGVIAAGNILKTVNDLLDVSQIEEGKYGYKFQAMDINEFAERVLAELMVYAKEMGIKLYLQKSENPIAVTIDPQKLGIVLANLVSNAIKYNIENGEVVVTIKAVAEKPYVEVSVKDTGIGIPADEMQRLFTKFFRADNAQKTVADGTGLGLYITKNIVRRHGGDIWAESQVSRGSTFYITIPTDPTLVPQTEMAFSDE